MDGIQRYAAIGALIAASASAQSLPHPDHIVVVMMENKSFDDIIDSSNAPYLNTLRTRGALFVRCQLQGASLTRAQLDGVHFIACDLTGADIPEGWRR